MASVSAVCRSVGLGAALATMLTGCGGGGPTQPTLAVNRSRLQTHVEGMLDIMQANSINRLTIDWPSLRATVSAQAAPAATIDQLYPAIRTALRLLGDGHSSYQSPDGDVLFVPTRSCLSMGIGTVDVPANVGYIRVRSFSGTAAEGTAFANALQRAIQDADRDGMTGWIVDVRGNGGGNMWPMIAGVGPVLGEGVAGYFIDPVGAESVWEYRDGASRLGNAVLQAVTTPYQLRRERPRVAVLIDNGTSSSGEATVIAFKQRPDTRFFGVGTCGVSTANRGFPLTEGATLNLTVSVMADRTKTRYGDVIAPDEVIRNAGETLQRAAAWVATGR